MGTLVLPREELNRVLRVLNLIFHFKQYLGCLYNHKSPACQASQLNAVARMGSSLRPRVIKTEFKTEEETVLDPLS
jgi:hypothetical protein